MKKKIYLLDKSIPKILWIGLFFILSLSLVRNMNFRPLGYLIALTGIITLVKCGNIVISKRDQQLCLFFSLLVFILSPIFSFYALSVNGFDFSVFDWMTIPKHAFNEFGY